MKYEIIDDAFTRSDILQFNDFARRSLFRIGWHDGDHVADVIGQRRMLYSEYSEEDLKNFEFFERNNSTRLKELIAGRAPQKPLINLVEPSNVTCNHSHIHQDSLIYYVNPRWLPEYAGETLIYEDDGEEACRAVSFVPGRVLWLHREVQHSIRPPSHACPTYRFTFACFFNEESK